MQLRVERRNKDRQNHRTQSELNKEKQERRKKTKQAQNTEREE
jgi:hypothetical protein